MRQPSSYTDLVLRAVVVLIFAAAGLPRALSAVHPVPLDPKIDSANCLECHADKTKGTAVHSAIATGCLSCHQVRVTKGTTRVMLITATPYRLCLTCHGDKDATQIKGHVHQPAVRDCLTCQAGYADDGNVRQGIIQAQKDGFAIMSQMISITEPKPGKPKANHQPKSKRLCDL